MKIIYHILISIVVLIFKVSTADAQSDSAGFIQTLSGEVYITTAQTIGSVLAALPDQPVHFILYFTGDSTELTVASRQTVPAILELINERKAQHTTAVGHSDTAGDRRYNVQLSQQRAMAIRHLLEQSGVAPGSITATSHGEENLLVKTGDNVHEAKNRRVEVVVK